jgi:broad specificity phosphatase PhoE
MVRIALIRPGCTSFDEEGRIKGSLDIPLSAAGERQSEKLALEISDSLSNDGALQKLAVVYSGPCQSALATAEKIAEHCGIKAKVMTCLENVDHGLWQGKLIEEVKRLQPRVYRQIQESSEAFAPPGGETLVEALGRIKDSVTKLVRKHKNDLLGLVVPDPMASVVRHFLTGNEIGDLWKIETDAGSWELIHVETAAATLV